MTRLGFPAILAVAGCLTAVFPISAPAAQAPQCHRPKNTAVVKESSAVVVYATRIQGDKAVNDDGTFDEYETRIFGCARSIGKTFLLVRNRVGDADYRTVNRLDDITLGRRSVGLRIAFKRPTGCDSAGGYRYSLRTGDWVRLWAHRLKNGACG